MLARDQIIEEALALGPEDRVFVIAALQQSLASADIPHEIQADDAEAISGAAFIAELERRSEAVRSGTMATFAAEDVIAELRARPRGEKSS